MSFRLRKWSARVLIQAVVVAGVLNGIAHADNSDLKQCDQSGDEVLAASSYPADARAHWLSRNLIKWPGVMKPGGKDRFRLYFSQRGTIEVNAQSRVVGSTGHADLVRVKTPIPKALRQRFRYLPEGIVLAVPQGFSTQRIRHFLRSQLVLAHENSAGHVLDHSGVQLAGVLDDLYALAQSVGDLGMSSAHEQKARFGFKLWAPTAAKVALCLYQDAGGDATLRQAMVRDPASGVWSVKSAAASAGSYYRYLVEVFAPGIGLVRNRVTDPYSLSLSANSRRSAVVDLNDPITQPVAWNSDVGPSRVKAPTDMVIYELHVRDFSINDSTVSAGRRGKFLAFTETQSNGMRHLRQLAEAGITDVHLLPIFDFATVPEIDCATPAPTGELAGESQQASVVEVRDRDCYNWGYDPLHFTAPEGSYATNPNDGLLRVLELRTMIQALHRSGLRVGMDVVYNHTPAVGQALWSVLDRIVPGYYQRLDLVGKVETSTCCFNTATENRMMAKLMNDSVLVWARDYHIDSFRFDLMGHQPRVLMENLKRTLRKTTGRDIQLIGEGWNFGEVASNARFVQASQLSLNGSGIGTFSDRSRDAVRGGSAADDGAALISRKGFINAVGADSEQLRKSTDMVRAGLAGTLRNFSLRTFSGETRRLGDIDYGGQPAGYASQPDEVVNYVENHDNQTLYDINAMRLPEDMTSTDRARVQVLGMALNVFSQGIAYFHAGMDILRSKSLDRNSFNSGDWFNRLDWTYNDNNFAVGLPPATDNSTSWLFMRPVLENPSAKPTPEDIVLARDAFRDLLKIRGSSTLFRIRSASEVERRLRFLNTGPEQIPGVIAARIEGRGYAGAGFNEVVYMVNASLRPQIVKDSALVARHFDLHPVHLAPGAADKRIAHYAVFDPQSGEFHVPPLSAVVFVGL